MVTSSAPISWIRMQKQTVFLVDGWGPAVAFRPAIWPLSNDMKYYTNDELLALNKDGFWASLSATNSTTRTMRYGGQTTNGDYVLGIFNRNDKLRPRTVDFSTFGALGHQTNP